MDIKVLEQLLLEVKDGRQSVAQALKRLRTLPFEDLGFARVDHHRQLRQGFPEVIFAEGKSSGADPRHFAGPQPPVPSRSW